MTSPSAAPRRRSPARILALGALTVGVLDIADAFVYFGFLGATPIRILQGIAGGLLGRDAFQGGLATAALGLACHFFVATTVVLTYYAASARLRLLIRRPFLSGTIYGLCVYVVMYFVVIPLSRAGAPHFTVGNVADELLAHTLLMGIPAALFTRAARAA